MIRRGEKDDITEPLFEYLQSVYDGDIENQHTVDLAMTIK